VVVCRAISTLRSLTVDSGPNLAHAGTAHDTVVGELYNRLREEPGPIVRATVYDRDGYPAIGLETISGDMHIS